MGPIAQEPDRVEDCSRRPFCSYSVGGAVSLAQVAPLEGTSYGSRDPK
jgi:hypothetical protein